PLPPLKNPKYRHISRSAAKRESVQMLGSIKDLQLRFSQAGLVEHRPGSGAGVKASLGSLGEDDELENRPPQITPAKKDRRPWKDVDLPRMDPLAARKEARGLVWRMRIMWDLPLPSPSPSPISPNTPITPKKARENMRDLLIKTAQAVRRVRTLTLSISHTHPGEGGRRISSSFLHAPRSASKIRTSFSTPSRPNALPRAVSTGQPTKKSSLGPGDVIQDEDPYLELRKTALDVLAQLRALEERLRIKNDTPPTSLRPTSAASGTSGVFSEPEGYYFDDEEEYNLNALARDEDIRHLLTWEERIIAEQREYRQLDEEEWESGGKLARESVTNWVTVVETLFAVEGGQMVDIPPWALSTWNGDDLIRTHSFLMAHLPLTLSLLLPPTSASDFRRTFLQALSDGYILVRAFNACLLSSRKTWGFISEEDVHDTITGTAGTTSPDEVDEGKKDWTFRRVGNLTCWAAALKTRYNIPIHLPSSTTASAFLPKPTKLLTVSSPNPQRQVSPPTIPSPLSIPLNKKWKKDESILDFDPLIVARRGEGWEDMLIEIMKRWVDAVAEEI
ncbi:hypothetical protein TREMEDRAFT_13823, partial [Tremella mesenterica DSM 1558]|uniref:uncharacterized protein n=1 Tax=Tremella mesenterica (strain ATCC 24925 / CBS 8224 / DSM 1558 / NBRC 9311 / NRRL Y-6157 / RJB 2259-6 / UBC 559-6) TaxID=578456 RepID=UPI00032C512C